MTETSGSLALAVIEVESSTREHKLKQSWFRDLRGAHSGSASEAGADGYGQSRRTQTEEDQGASRRARLRDVVSAP